MDSSSTAFRLTSNLVATFCNPCVTWVNTGLKTLPEWYYGKTDRDCIGIISTL